MTDDRRAKADAAAARATETAVEDLREGDYVFFDGRGFGVVTWIARHATLAEVGLDDGRILRFGRKQFVKGARP